MTIPEIGTVRATHPPVIVLTSNRTRDLHDAVKRRCLYQWIDYPSPEREVEIVRRRVKGASESLAVQVAATIARIRASDVQKPPGIAEAIDWLAALDLLGVETLDAAGDRPHARLGAQVRRGPGRRPRGRPRPARGEPRVTDARFTVRTIELDLPALAGAFGAGCTTRACRSRPSARRASPRRSPSCGRSRGGGCTGPRARCSSPTRRRSGRSTRSSPRSSARATSTRCGRFPRTRTASRPPPDHRPSRTAASNAPARRSRSAAIAPAGSRPPGAAEPDDDDREVAVPVAASDEERLRNKRFDALEPGELARLYRLMSRLEIATPTRRTRRAERDRRGEHVDLRRTLRGSLRTAGDPIRLARRRRRVVRRRIVMLCDISGSMEPYARAYLQFLTCAAGAGPNAEAFVFATRLTRVTRALPDAQPGAGDPARRGRRAGLVERHADRRRAARVQRPPRPARDGARRGRRDHLRRLGARRPGARRPRDGAPRAARLPDRVGQPARRRARLLAAGGRHGGRARALRRARQRPQPRRARGGRRRDRGRARHARGARRGRRRRLRRPSPRPTTSRGPARRRCPAARSRCRAATARAAATRPRDGA